MTWEKKMKHYIAYGFFGHTENTNQLYPHANLLTFSDKINPKISQPSVLNAFFFYSFSDELYVLAYVPLPGYTLDIIGFN